MSNNAHKNKSIHYPKESRGLNFFDLDRDMQAVLNRVAPGVLKNHKHRLSDFGAWVGQDLDAQAEYSDRYAPPQLQTYSKYGDKTGRVVFNPLYDQLHQEAYKKGIVGLAFDKANPAPHMLSFAMGYMMSQTDISIHCPVTMTGAVAYVLEHFAPKDVKEKYLHEVTRMDGQTKTGGTWATELHGGSDVAQTTTRAVKQKDGSVKLYGLKWFTSNANSGLAVATARPEGAPDGNKGLGLYLIPSHLEDGSENPYHIRRLKEKLGTKALPTGEIDLDGAYAIEIAPPPNGLKIMMEALEYSRIHNAVAASGAHRRAFLEMMCWVSNRKAFGNTIKDYPMVREQVLNTMTTLEASTALSFHCAAQFDKSLEDDRHRVWLRLSTALAKYKTAEWCVQATKNAIEVVGGNGYTEEFPTARLFRDSMVLPVWEGPANIQALELLRMVLGKKQGGTLFLKQIKDILDTMPRAMTQEKQALDKAYMYCKNALTHLQKHPQDGQVFGRNLLDLMSDTLAGALLCAHAAHDLKLGNARKAIVARRFLTRFLHGNVTPQIGKDHKDPALDHFDALTQFQNVAPEKAGYKKTASKPWYGVFPKFGKS